MMFTTAVMLLLASVPAVAQDVQNDGNDATSVAAADPLAEAQKQKALSEARKAAAEARKAEIEAEAALEKARFSFLPQSPADGKVTLGEGAGAMEVAMLTAIAIRAAAAQIKTAAAPPQGTLLIGGADTLDLSALLAFQAESVGVEAELRDALEVADLAPCTAAPPGPELVPGIGPVITAFAGMLRTDTESRGIKTEIDAQVLTRAVLKENPGLIVPRYRVKPSAGPDNLVVCTLTRFDAARGLVRARLKVKPAPSDDRKAKLTAAATRSEEFYQSWTKPATDGTVRLASAIAQAELVPAGSKVLRVFLDKQGGSLLTRRNLWTALGAKAIAVSGGAVVSFTLDDPFTGKVEKSGVFICGTTLTDYRKVHRLEGLGGKCIPVEGGTVDGERGGN